MDLNPQTSKSLEIALGPHAARDLRDRVAEAMAAGGGGSGSTTWTWSLALGVDAAVGQGVGLWRVVQAATAFSRADLSAVTGPAGASLVADIELSADGGATWASLWHSTPANRPKILAGVNAGHATSFDTTAASAGNLLRATIAAVGVSQAGRGITLQLRGS